MRLIQYNKDTKVTYSDTRDVAIKVVDYLIDNKVITEFEDENQWDFHIQDVIHNEINDLLGLDIDEKFAVHVRDSRSNQCNMYSTFLTIELGRLLGVIPKDLELDLTYEKATILYSEFETSDFNDADKSEYDCIYNFLLMKSKSRLKLKVHWLNERCDDKDDNDGKHFGIYIFDCLEKDFDSELGYGSYDILQVHWFESEIIRDVFFDYVWEDLLKTDQYLLNNESITQDQRELILELILSQNNL